MYTSISALLDFGITEAAAWVEFLRHTEGYAAKVSNLCTSLRLLHSCGEAFEHFDAASAAEAFLGNEKDSYLGRALALMDLKTALAGTGDESFHDIMLQCEVVKFDDERLCAATSCDNLLALSQMVADTPVYDKLQGHLDEIAASCCTWFVKESGFGRLEKVSSPLRGRKAKCEPQRNAGNAVQKGSL